jgi:hypothetical protein
VKLWEYNTATLLPPFLGGYWEEDQFRGKHIFQALDTLGAEGWELISTVPVVEAGHTTRIQYLFKRPLN